MSSEPSKATVTVLVVDDYEDNRQMYAELLTFAGFDVLEARNGAEGLAIAQSALPNLIVMDLSLPVMDGWEATRRIKADERTKHIPVLALSGHAPEGIDGHSAAVAETGCDGFLAKPCTPESLLEMVHGVLDRTRRNALRATIPPAHTRRLSG
jgi:CheY-like chemotaxis protein